MSKPRILVFCDYYLPGYKSGGGMRTIVNMVERLGSGFDFRIVTRDHDGKLDRDQYTSVEIDSWNHSEGHPIYYLSKKSISLSAVRSLINEIQPDVIYTNSFFSTLAIYVLKLKKLRAIEQIPVIVAPCGELASGALSVKSSKKKAFLSYAKFTRLYSNVIWKASTEGEADEIRSLGSKNADVFVAADLPPATIFDSYESSLKPKKEVGNASFAFLSRYVRAKNFNWLIPVLSKVKSNINLEIIGPLEDKDYWDEAQELINELPENISVKAIGPLPHPQVSEKLAQYHFFTSATLGENFGHIFLEALSSGCPLVISNTTPWTDLQELGIGWDLDLSDPERWVSAFEECAAMDESVYSAYSNRARKYSEDWLATPTLDEDTVRVLEHALSVKG